MEYLVNISKRRAFWSLNEDILKITVLTTNTPYPSRKIRTYPFCCALTTDPNETRSIRRISDGPIETYWKYSLDEVPPKSKNDIPPRDKKHFKTLSLDELRSPDFNLFSDQEYSEEEVAKTIAETMEQYMSKTRADYVSGVARPKIEDKDNFELKGQFLKELRTNTFSGSDHEDANEHIEKVLEIVKTNETLDNTVKLTGTFTGIPVKEAEGNNETENKLIEKAKKEEVVEAPSSRPVEYYLKHRINEKLIEGIVDNPRFNDSGA
ncbi:hypothetical protein Tco_0323859 [Tanacetum coccineum]